MFLTRTSPETGLAACESRAAERWCIGCGDAADPSERAVSVSGPGSIADIAVEFSRVVNRADERGVERLRVGVDLLDPLLERAEPSRAFRFLHVFSGYVRNRGLFAAAAFDPDAYDGATVRNVEALFDFALAVRRDGSGDPTAQFRALSPERSGLTHRSEAEGRTE